MNNLVQVLLSGLAVGCIYALVAIGFVLIYKSTRILNFAQGELMMLGTYFAFIMMTNYQISLPITFFLTFLFSLFIGMLLERVFLRPMIGEPIISVIMLTIGLSVLLRSITGIIFGADDKIFPQMFMSTTSQYLGISISYIDVSIIGVTLLLLTLFTFFFKYSSLGIQMQAVACDQNFASLYGVSVKRVFSASWAISAVVAAMGGIFLANIFTLNLNFSLMGIKAFPAAILGGLDSIPGAILGGLILGIVESLAGYFLDPLVGGGVKEVIGFIVLLIVLIIRPYGLFGMEEIERV